MALKGVSAPAVAAAGAGALFIWSGLKGGAISTNVRSILSGGQLTGGANQIAGQTVAANMANVAGGISSSGGTTSANASGGKTANLTGNKAIVNTVAATYGWGTGAEWNALVNIINAESGFNNNAQNPTSTAYGIFQFLDSTWATVGAKKTSSPLGQALAGMKYIKQRYGDPVKAWAFHLANGWY